MLKFKEFMAETEEDQYLYHATYQPHMKKIKKEGLHGEGKKNWSDSKRGVIYLAKNPDVAESYAETSEDVPEHYLDNIRILKVRKSKLDSNLLKQDSNVRNDDTETVEYHGKIHPDHLEIHK